MIKTILSTLILATISLTASAEYSIKIPLEVAQGGTLPNGSISFKSTAPVEPPILNCTAYAISDECDKRLNAWDQFAVDKGLSNDWNYLFWFYNNLTNIPSEPYPITDVDYFDLTSNQLTSISGLSNLRSANILNLTDNQLTNLDGLSNLETVSDLYAYNNRLVNLNGLSRLTSIGSLDLSNNKLDDLSGLSRLTSVIYLNLYNNLLTDVNGLSNITNAETIELRHNNLTNLNGLANIAISDRIYIDISYSGPKLAATTRFCSLNSPARFGVGYAQKTQLCESP